MRKEPSKELRVTAPSRLDERQLMAVSVEPCTGGDRLARTGDVAIDTGKDERFVGLRQLALRGALRHLGMDA
jgi:hypothetical protein